jgi:tyrosinase
VSCNFNTDGCETRPIFFLHHVQLDRLWWEWQQEDPANRLTEYAGEAFSNTGPERLGTLDDHLMFMGLWDDVKVSKVMRTDTDFLCYRY